MFFHLKKQEALATIQPNLPLSEHEKLNGRSRRANARRRQAANLPIFSNIAAIHRTE